jgi:hypothetical protein
MLGRRGGYFFVPKNVTKSVINAIIKDNISYVLISTLCKALHNSGYGKLYIMES